MPIYRPRCALQLTVPQMGTSKARKVQADDTSTYTIQIDCKKVELVSNDHNHADECRVTVPFRDLGCDVRLLQNACGVLYLGEADDYGRWMPSLDNARFAGILTRSERFGDSSSGLDVELEFLDYTRLFLLAKPFGSDGIPSFSQDLQEAWKRVVSQTPGAAILSDRIEFQGMGQIPKLGTAVSKRFAKLLKVPVKPRTDAWAVWQQCVGMLGLISYIRLDKCIVTTATNYYTRQDPPRMIWGKNILDIKEARDEVFRKGICMTSYDPLSRKTIDGFYPPIGDKSIRKKNVAPKRVGDKNAVLLAEDREFFPSPYPTTDQKTLENIAHRVYEERSRQELEGNMTTKEMATRTLAGGPFNLLELAAGDDIRVEFGEDDRELLSAYAKTASVDEMAAYLIKIGYSRPMAELMARNAKDLAKLDPTFLVKRVDTTLDTDGETFELKVNYCNRILVTGDAAR